MFYKLKGISKKSGKGTVSVVYRTKEFETLKSTSVTVAPSDFDSKAGKVKKRVPEHPELNAKIQEVASCFEMAARNVLEAGHRLTKDALETQYAIVEMKLLFSKEVKVTIDDSNQKKEEEIEELEDVLLNKKAELARRKAIINPANKVIKTQEGSLESEVTIFAVDKPSKRGNRLTDKIAEFLKRNPENYGDKTVLGYLDLKAIISKFRPGLVIEDINIDVFQDLQNFLVKRGIRNQSIRITFARLKKVYSYFADELNLPTAFIAKFKMVKELYNDNVLFLTPEEVDMIERVELKSKAQNQIRWQFLFTCEVALRYSDLYITPANVKKNELHVTMQKSKHTVKPPLTARAKAILASEYFPFKRICASQYNKTLRLIAKKAGLVDEIVQTHYVGNKPVTEVKQKWELVSSHVGRKTAINNWLNKGVRESVVALWAGHQNTKMIQKHYQNKDAASAMEFQKLLWRVG